MWRASFFGLMLAATLLIPTMRANASLIGLEVQQTLNDTQDGNQRTSLGRWTSDSAGWYFTATKSFDVQRVETLFGEKRGNNTVNVGVQIFSAGDVTAPPVNGINGTLLGTGSITVTSSNVTDYVGGDLTSTTVGAPISLVAGQEYFIGFTGIKNLGTNTAASSLATNNLGIGSLFTDVPPSNASFSQRILSQEPDRYTPIIRFSGTAVPEPASILLLGIGTGVMGLGGWVRRKKASNKVSPEAA